jgi:hypothetical protein
MRPARQTGPTRNTRTGHVSAPGSGVLPHRARPGWSPPPANSRLLPSLEFPAHRPLIPNPRSLRDPDGGEGPWCRTVCQSTSEIVTADGYLRVAGIHLCFNWIPRSTSTTSRPDHQRYQTKPISSNA